MSSLDGSRSSLLRGSLETAAIHFEHPVNDTRVNFVGVTHVGRPEYYASVGSILMDRSNAGAVTLCESIGPQTGPVTWPDPSKRSTQLAWLAQRYNLAGQHMLTPPPNSSFCDMDRAALRQHAAAYSIDSADIEDYLAPPNLAVKLADKIGLAAALHFPNAVRLALGASANNKTAKKVSAMRDEFILKTIDKLHAPDNAITQEISLLWGAGHASGVGKGLFDRGYRVRSKRWLTAIRFDGR